MKIPDAVAAIVMELARAGRPTWYCGDTVRAWLMEESPTVYRVLTGADLVALARLHEALTYPGVPGCNAELKREDFTLRFRCFTPALSPPSWEQLRSLTASEILTIDTFLFDPLTELFHDPWSALPGLLEKKLSLVPGADLAAPRAVLKTLDAIVLSSHHGFAIPPDASRAWKSLTPAPGDALLPEVVSRLDRALTSRNPHAALVALDRFNILTELFPELIPAMSLRQDKDFHPEGTVYEHTLECFRFVESPSLPLALGLLLHDVGKPSTATLQKNLRYPGHSRVGATIARRCLRRLGYGEALIEKVVFLIRHHLVAHELRRMSKERQQELMRSELLPDLLRLYKADIRSCYGDLSQYYKVLAMADEAR